MYGRRLDSDAFAPFVPITRFPNSAVQDVVMGHCEMECGGECGREGERERGREGVWKCGHVGMWECERVGVRAYGSENGIVRRERSKHIMVATDCAGRLVGGRPGRSRG